MTGSLRTDGFTARSHAMPGETWRGELELRVARRGERSVAVHQWHRGSLRVLRPIHLDGTGQVLYVVVNPGGAYLDQDGYRIEVDVEAGGDLLLTTQSATKVYRTPRGEAVQQMAIRLGEDARLEHLPDTLIAYRDAAYRQSTVVNMHPSASLVTADAVTPGWSPSGEGFLYRSLRLRTEVRMEGRPVVLDHLVLDPEDGAGGMNRLGLLEEHSHVASLLVVDPRCDDDALRHVRQVAQTHADRVLAGVSALSVPGLAVRALGDSTQDLERLVADVASALRAGWRGQGPLDLRKY